MIFLPLGVLAQTTSENYIKTTTYKKASSEGSVNPNNPEDATITIQYFDGLGRPKQQIAHKQSASGNDIINHMEYDALGRQTKEYLPYTDGTSSLNIRTNALGDLLNFYSEGDPVATGNPHFDTTTNPYSETFFEPSPLNRTRKIGAPGNIWKGNENNDNDRTIKFDYKTNNTNEVKRFTVTTTLNGNGVFDPILTPAGTYNANELYVTITKDENWTQGNLHTTREYKDKQGRVVLKRTYGISTTRDLVGTGPTIVHDTYYVYDDYGNLTFVFTPLMDKNNITQAAIDGLGYQYKYDHRNRLVEKKLPGKQWEYIVYDKLDRPVASGPAHSPFTDFTNEGWLITKYDGLDRPIITGWMEETVAFSSTTRRHLQVAIDNQTNFNEQKTTSNTTIGSIAVRYTNTVTPTSFYVLTVNYFDDYNFPNAPSSIPSTVEGQNVYYNNTNQKPKGLPTATWERVGPYSSASQQHEFSYLFYDKYANPIRIFTKNYINGFTEVDTQFDFSGKVLKTKTKHKQQSTSDELIIEENFEYTPQDRLKKHKHKINQMNEQILSDVDYDALGQLILKRVGSDINNPWQNPHLQDVNYRYNIRGWLTDINDVNDLTAGQPGGNGPVDLFAFKINYTGGLSQDYEGAVSSLYNGNISETFWRSGSDNVLRRYGYAYDPMNRLTNAIYGKPNTTPSITNNYNEWLSYDANGNILSLGRNGISDSHNDLIQIDDLEYHYKDEHSNILIGVNDLSGNTAGFHKDYHTFDFHINPDYEYDDNGNLILDKTKNITNITYNHLNLPVKITFENNSQKYIEYLYAATGEKQMKIVRHNDSISHTRYIHGFQYYDNVLQFFHTPEGYVKNTPDTEGNPSFDYVYQYKDHLGNVRVNYAQDPLTGETGILEESHYYPFGLQHSNYNSDLIKIDRKEENNNEKSFDDTVTPFSPFDNPGYKYKFGGKELQSEFGIEMYDFGARNYDPALGRWMNIDPLTDNMRNNSPYNYAFNNPVLFIDYAGLFPIVIHVRSFAPFEYFGLGLWSGDNRNFSLDLNVSSRLSQSVYMDTSNGLISEIEKNGSISHSKYGAVAYSEAHIKNYSSAYKVNTHLYGKNRAFYKPAFQGLNYKLNPTWDIDIHTNIDISLYDHDSSTQLLIIKGKITGDGFPNAEAFVSDDFGNSIFLGVFGVSKNSGIFTGPFLNLWYDFNREMMDIMVAIKVNDQGEFLGVYYQGRLIDINAWNSITVESLTVDQFKNKYPEWYDTIFGNSSSSSSNSSNNNNN